MQCECDILSAAAELLLQTEKFLSGQFIPAKRNPLPKISIDTEIPETEEIKMKSSDTLAQMTEEVQNCTACQLCQKRTQIVFGEGSEKAKLVFVGEAPGKEEDKTGKPFIGRAGELLTKMINAMGLSRDDVYICNMVKCRPPDNRTPTPQEVQACWGYLVRQLSIIRPEVIVTLGNPATQGLLNTKVGITRLRGIWTELDGIAQDLDGTAVMPTFHPSYILRQYSPDTRSKVWSDLKKVMKKLGLKSKKK